MMMITVSFTASHYFYGKEYTIIKELVHKMFPDLLGSLEIFICCLYGKVTHFAFHYRMI